jgi:sulfate permease, SulP family
MANPGTTHYAEFATLLALMVGAILIAVGLFRAGWLATLLSNPVTTGFLAGISIHIIIGQLPTLLGIPDPGGPILLRLLHILDRLPDANPYVLALGAGVLAVTLGTQASVPRSRGHSLACSAQASPSWRCISRAVASMS